MNENINYKYLIGQFITKIKEDKDCIYFFTKENYVIKIEKFIPYCACNVGEYIDEIIQDGVCMGVITDIKEDIKFLVDDEIVYKGKVTFFFENGKINIKVHGEDNGYYGVCFTMPVVIFRSDE